MTGRLNYRPDLDGLRAVAVVPVILFHFGFPYTPGGFVGVDIFFVLSGYFITRQIALALDENSFSILDFYDRRIRRLFPALFAMLAASSLVAFLLLLPDDLSRFGQSLAAAAASVSNIYFLYTSDYFAPSADTMPLIHTWSLAVEEQFYLVFPFLLMMVWRLGRVRAIYIITSLAAVSLAASIWGTHAKPQAAFYLLPSRAWELLLGSALALHQAQTPNSSFQTNLAAITGLVGIITSIVLYNAEMPFPGLAAALPCAGCALLIWAGEPPVNDLHDRSSTTTLVGRVLSLSPIVLAGLISYSLYLWHWPIIVFARHAAPEGLSFMQSLFAMLATVCIALVSWKFIEKPMRTGKIFWTSRRQRLVFGGALVSAFSASGIALHAGQGFPLLHSNEVLAALEDNKNTSPVRKKCHWDSKKIGVNDLGDACQFGKSGSPRVIVFGDSHGAEISYALSEIADGYGIQVQQITASGCPPAFNFSPANRDGCPRHVEKIVQSLSQSPPSTILIAAYFFRWGAPRTTDRHVFWNGLEHVVTELRKQGHLIILLGDVPPHPYGRLPLTIAKEIKLGRSPNDYKFPIDTAVAEDVGSKLAAIAARQSVVYLPLLQAVCEGETLCRGYLNGHAIYFDEHHLAVTTARRVVRDIVLPALTQLGAASSIGPRGTNQSK